MEVGEDGRSKVEVGEEGQGRSVCVWGRGANTSVDGWIVDKGGREEGPREGQRMKGKTKGGRGDGLQMTRRREWIQSREM